MAIFKREGNTVVQVTSDGEIQAARVRDEIARLDAKKLSESRAAAQIRQLGREEAQQVIDAANRDREEAYRAQENAKRVQTEQWVARRSELQQEIQNVDQLIGQLRREPDLSTPETTLAAARDVSLLGAAERLRETAASRLAEHKTRHPG